MNTHKLSILFAVLSVLAVSLTARGEPDGTAPAYEEQIPGTESGKGVSRTGTYWRFTSPPFSFALPEAMEGRYYPDADPAHGVIFHPGSGQNPRERRELSFVARPAPSDLDEQQLWWRQWDLLKEADPGRHEAYSYREPQAGVDFYCSVAKGKQLGYMKALALDRDNAVVYELTLVSTEETWDRDYELARRTLATFRPDAPLVREGVTMFTKAMAGLYNSPEAPVRVLAYTNTLNVPRHAHLEKELRARLQQTSSLTEQYIINYVLASITRYESDFATLMEHVYRHPFVVRYGSGAVLDIGNGFLEDLYPWMAGHNVYGRDALLCGIMCQHFRVATLSSEARYGYAAKFPKAIQFAVFLAKLG